MARGPSLLALALDLIEDEPDDERPTLEEALARCPRGQVMAARHGGCDVAVCRLADGRAFALPDRCPHDGGRLSDGFVEGEVLVCSRHGWEVDPATGRRVQRRPGDCPAAGAARPAP